MDNIIFYFFSGLLLFSAIKTITHRNPILSALYLAVSMVAVAGIFYLLGAHFLAGVQLAVYAGAVIVLFVIVLMLFDLKQEAQLGFFKHPLKIFFPVFLFGIASGVMYITTLSSVRVQEDLEFFSSKSIALKLFTKHLLIFELLGLLLLVIAIGIVALVRLDKDS